MLTIAIIWQCGLQQVALGLFVTQLGSAHKPGEMNAPTRIRATNLTPCFNYFSDLQR